MADLENGNFHHGLLETPPTLPPTPPKETSTPTTTSASGSFSGSTSGYSSIWFEVGHIPLDFIGRATELADLHRLLTEPRTRSTTKPGFVNICTLFGPDGIGKSALARKYVFENWATFDGNVIWIDAESMESAHESFTRLARALQVEFPCQAPPALHEVTAAVYEKFRGGKCLFIFDNVTSREVFTALTLTATCKPRSSSSRMVHETSETTLAGPHALVTCRNPDLILKKRNRLKLEGLRLGEAVRLLQDELTMLTSSTALYLAENLRRRPRALEQTCLLLNGHSSGGGSSPNSPLEDEGALSRFSTWNIGIRKLLLTDERRKSAFKYVINTLCYLNADAISVEFMITLFGDAEESLGELERFAIVRLEGGRVIVDRLMQEVLRLSFTDVEEVGILSLITHQLRDQFQDLELSEQTREGLGHAMHVFPLQLRHAELMKESVGYLSALCSNLLEYRHCSEALSIASRASQFFETLQGYGPEHQNTIEMKFKAAEALYYLRRYSEAIWILEELLPISLSKLEEENVDPHPHPRPQLLTLNILRVIANVRSDLGDHAYALQMSDEILSLSLGVFHGKEDPEVLLVKEDRAKYLKGLGRYAEADTLLEHVHKKYVELFGENDALTMRARYSLADTAYDNERLQEAIEIYEELYEQYIHGFGEDHPRTLDLKRRIEQLKEQITNC